MENVSGRTISADQSRQWARVSDLLPCLENLKGVGRAACRGPWLPHVQQASRPGRVSALLGPALGRPVGPRLAHANLPEHRGARAGERTPCRSVPGRGQPLQPPRFAGRPPRSWRTVPGSHRRGGGLFLSRGDQPVRLRSFAGNHPHQPRRPTAPRPGALPGIPSRGPARPEAVLLFPEGTRSPTGSLQPFKVGVGLLAVESGAPVVPARIDGTHALMPRGKHGRDPGRCASAWDGPCGPPRRRSLGRQAVTPTSRP